MRGLTLVFQCLDLNREILKFVKNIAEKLGP